MRTAAETFGTSGAQLASEQIVDPQSAPSPVATTRVQNAPSHNPIKALLDPQGSAIFWIALAALLGLVLVTGQLKIQGALGLGGRAGKG
ncbi:MAG TPA: hypothetical protein VGJ25_09120 [Gaiellaceae bacterium]|jgi:hypothetical protein